MPCGNCIASQLLANNLTALRKAKKRLPNAVIECDYTIQMLENYLEKLTWFKEGAKFIKYNIKPKILNQSLGTIKSALNTSNPCMFEERIEKLKIKDLVNLIIMAQENDE